MPTPTFTSREIETGRKLFAQPWDFATAASSSASLPKPRGVEVAFAGRSNVGKSSLINALTGRKALARTSHTPGRTQELIFFSAGGPLTIVDMPGYGFAAAPKAKVAAWTDLVRSYLQQRRNLARVYLLVDSRHGLKEPDEETMAMLDRAAVNYQIVLTKADEPRADALAEVAASVEAGLARRPAAFPHVLAVSSHAGTGVAELRAAVARLIAERGV